MHLMVLCFFSSDILADLVKISLCLEILLFISIECIFSIPFSFHLFLYMFIFYCTMCYLW